MPVPVFPRPQTNWQIYTHALDRDVMHQKGNELERINLQLIRMIEDARARLDELEIDTEGKILLTGFSASGTFANRFSLLHPDKLKAIAAGGINGLLMLPVDTIEGQAFDFPLGIADIGLFCKKDFREKEFSTLPQFYFMGKSDTNDAVLYDDAFDESERNLIYKFIGEQMQPRRWSFCQDFYKKHNVNAQFKTYANYGHEHAGEVKKDMVHFFIQATDDTQ